MHLPDFFKQAADSEKAGQIDLAESLYKTILEKDPQHSASCYNLATLYAKRNDYEKAIFYFKKLLVMQNHFAEGHYNLAICYMKKMRIEEAVLSLKQAIAIRPDYAAAQHLLGGILLRQMKIDEAVFHLETAQRLSKDAAVYCHLGMAYCHQARLEEAQWMLESALELDKTLPEIYYHLGVIALRKGNLESAIQFFEDTTGRDPLHFEAYYNLGLIYKNQHKYQLADYCWEKAQQLAPDNSTVAFLRAALKQAPECTAMPSSFVAELFNHYADYYDQHLQEVLNTQVLEQLKLLWETKTEKSTHLKILDLGCGTGLAGILFREYADELVGVDLSTRMVEKAQEKNQYDQLYVSDGIDFLNGREQCWDLVIAADVLSYLGELTHFFAGLAHSLKDGGQVLFSFEEGAFPFHIAKEARFYYHPDYILQTAEQNGIKVDMSPPTLLRDQLIGRIAIGTRR